LLLAFTDNTVNAEQIVREIYRKLSREWGPQHWWPAESPFEVIVGAILTQNTSWTNVERALSNLRSAGVLTLEGIRELPMAELERMVWSSGYFRQKAVRLKSFVSFVDRAYGGSLDNMFARPLNALRAELLTISGIGPETADSILLYVGQHAIFVVDAYTRRVLQRHEAIARKVKYDDVRDVVERALQTEELVAISESSETSRPLAVHAPSAMSRAKRERLTQVYNEMHGLFVQLGKSYCTKREPKCYECPLGTLLEKPLKRDWPLKPAGRRGKASLLTSKKARETGV
jgi:endonuclease III related protein